MKSSSISLAVSWLTPELESQARQLASDLELPVFAPDADVEVLLQCTADGLQLQPLGPGASGAVKVDFGGSRMRHRRKGGQMEPLSRAVGASRRERVMVVDATAGLGRDAFVLADSGCDVLMLERSPLMHALLADSLQRALGVGDAWLHEACSRMRLLNDNAERWLKHSDEDVDVDVVYLDPMFPRRQKSARVKKEMLIFQTLLQDTEPGPELLVAALDRARYRVVVKRPLKAPPLNERAPSFSLKGKAIRFDVYALKRMDA